MSIYEKIQSAAIAEYRQATEKPSMTGVTHATFMCRRCRQPKFMQGRQAVNDCERNPLDLSMG